MGGVNFTRNRAWWHTVIWDEYGQKHQYVAIIPTMMFMFPFYWYGGFINRDLEGNFAAKMYQLDYENSRNRLTHNLIMEHFEMHTEKVVEILDGVKNDGFEKTFNYELKTPSKIERDENNIVVDEELLAEIDEYTGMTGIVDEINDHQDIPYYLRQRAESLIRRRTYPGTPFKKLSQIKGLSSYDTVEHVDLNPNEGSQIGFNHYLPDSEY